MDELWDRIESLNGDFKRAMALVERDLLRKMPRDQPRALYAASQHLIKTGGKRIRPALIMLSYMAAGNKTDLSKVLPVAAAVELIHTATLVHDDIIDKSAMRRGTRTVSAQWGNDAALVVGDLLFSKAFGIIGTQENRELSAIIARACTKLAEGEVLEMLHTGDIDITEEVYLEIVERKTASLFEACTRCGALLGGASKDAVEALARYGYYLGTGFQIADDILDVISGEFKLGKPIGSDIALGKPTLVLLHALKCASDGEKQTLERIMRGEMNSGSYVKKALKIVRSTNSIDYASKRARSLVERARAELDDLPDSKAKEALELVAEYAINRDF